MLVSPAGVLESTNGKVNFSRYESNVSMLAKFTLCYDGRYVKLKAVSTEWPDPYENIRTK